GREFGHPGVPHRRGGVDRGQALEDRGRPRDLGPGGAPVAEVAGDALGDVAQAREREGGAELAGGGHAPVPRGPTWAAVSFRAGGGRGSVQSALVSTVAPGRNAGCRHRVSLVPTGILRVAAGQLL